MIRALPVPADRVVVLGNIPQFDHAGPECLSLNPQDVQLCTSPDLAYNTGHSAAERRAAERTGARYIDVVPWLCSAVCTDVIGQYLPYFDGFHVTADYSFALAGVLAGALDLGSYASTGPPAATPATTPPG
jgi:hypothetical protein